VDKAACPWAASVEDRPRTVIEASSTSWDELTGERAPHMDFVFTVCDNAAAEPCPVWPGQPMSAYWGVPDPAATSGTEAETR